MPALRRVLSAGSAGLLAIGITALGGGTAMAGTVVTVQNPGPQNAYYGYQVPVQIHASDSDPSKTLSYSAGGLPPGLSIDSATGLISGTPTLCTPVTFGFSTVVTVSDGSSNGTTSISWTMNSHSPCPH